MDAPDPTAPPDPSGTPYRSAAAPWWRALTLRGAGTAGLGLVLLVGGLSLHYPVPAALGAVLVALVALELTSVLGSRPVRPERIVEPRVVRRHEGCRGRLSIAGCRRRGLIRVEVADQVDGRLVPVRLPERAGSLAEETSTVDYPIPTPRRGLVEVGPVRVRLVGLTGMAARGTDVGEPDRVRVLPRLVPIDTMLPGHRREPSGADDSLAYGGTDLVGLHPYTMGDDLRRLHWATSARTGSLMVREDAEPSEPWVCVLLDDRATSYRLAPHRAGTGVDDDRFEEAVEVAAALCRTSLLAGHPTRLVLATGRAGVSSPGSSGSGLAGGGEDLRDVDWLLAEIGLAEPAHAPRPDPVVLDSRGGLDIAVTVTGPTADLTELGLATAEAGTQVVTILDPAPAVAASHDAGRLVLRAASSTTIALLWDDAVRR